MYVGIKICTITKIKCKITTIKIAEDFFDKIPSFSGILI